MTISSGSIALALQQRDQRQLGAARIAAGIGDEPRRFDLRPIDFGQAVDRPLLQFRRGVRMAVPARISGRIGEAEIGGQIDHLVAGARASKSLMTFCVVPCGSAQNDQIEPERLPVDAVDAPSARQRVGRELRKHVRHRLAGAAIGREQRDLDARMADQQPHQFRTGIAGGAENADLCFCRHDSPFGLEALKPASAGRI